MERLTFDGNFCEIAQCKEVKCPYDTACSQKQVWERLKQYEDTGLEPEAVETVKLALCAKHMVDLETLNNTPISRLVELAEADKDGRVVVLPCRGDADIELMRNGVGFKPDHWNIHLTTFAENQPTPSGTKVALLDLREVQESMEGKA